MKKLTYIVTVEFEDKITSDEEINEVGNNIAEAIVSDACNGMGISPREGETYTKSVTVKPQFLEEVVTKKLI